MCNNTDIYKKGNVAASIVIYNSSLNVIDNIRSYIDQVDRIYIIDNSEIPNNNLVLLISHLPNACYFSNNGNMGIAYALNKAAGEAIKEGYHFLLTMDDDTYLPEDSVEKMLFFLKSSSDSNIAIVGGQSNPDLFDESIKGVLFTITSGNLLNLSVYKKIGPFLNELFIDYVDHEYCFRIHKYGYKIFEMNNIHLTHELGSQKKRKFLGINFTWTSHNPIRIYYKTRNCFIVLRRYDFLPFTVKFYFWKDVIRDLIKMIFFENNKRYRFELFIKALSDAHNETLGKINFN